MIDVFVIRRFYGTEGEQNRETEGNEISRKEKEGKRAAPVFMKPKAQ